MAELCRSGEMENKLAFIVQKKTKLNGVIINYLINISCLCYLNFKMIYKWKNPK
jgi:hypothetical protein